MRMIPAALFIARLLCAGPADGGADAQAIMAKVASNMEKSAEMRRQFVYRQSTRASLIRAGGELARRESREYAVAPEPQGTEKKLVSFQGEYRRGKQMFAYAEPGFKYKENDIDGELLGDLVNDLTNDQHSRDGISESLFPLRTKDLGAYRFALKGQTNYQGRRAYRISFEPAGKDLCLHIGDEGNDCADRPWKGEAIVDAEEMQPMRIDTALARKIPWAVRTLLGTNLRQTGFSISYIRLAEGVWFPHAYGTEFTLDLLWLYKRTITLALENSAFQKAGASSTIAYELEVAPAAALPSK